MMSNFGLEDNLESTMLLPHWLVSHAWYQLDSVAVDGVGVEFRVVVLGGAIGVGDYAGDDYGVVEVGIGSTGTGPVVGGVDCGDVDADGVDVGGVGADAWFGVAVGVGVDAGAGVGVDESVGEMDNVSVVRAIVDIVCAWQEACGATVLGAGVAVGVADAGDVYGVIPGHAGSGIDGFDSHSGFDFGFGLGSDAGGAGAGVDAAVDKDRTQ